MSEVIEHWVNKSVDFIIPETTQIDHNYLTADSEWILRSIQYDLTLIKINEQHNEGTKGGNYYTYVFAIVPENFNFGTISSANNVNVYTPIGGELIVGTLTDDQTHIIHNVIMTEITEGEPPISVPVENTLREQFNIQRGHFHTEGVRYFDKRLNVGDKVNFGITKTPIRSTGDIQIVGTIRFGLRIHLAPPITQTLEKLKISDRLITT